MIHKGICNHSCAPVVNHSYAPACNHSYTMDGLAERIAKIRKEAGDTLRNPPGPAVATPIQHPPIGGIFFAR